MTDVILLSRLAIWQMEGFALQGGDVEGRSVAALVYVSSGHLVNVLMWPTKEVDGFPHTESVGGYRPPSLNRRITVVFEELVFPWSKHSQFFFLHDGNKRDAASVIVIGALLSLTLLV